MRQVLDNPTQLEFVETPALDVVDYLTDLHGLPFEPGKFRLTCRFVVSLELAKAH